MEKKAPENQLLFAILLLFIVAIAVFSFETVRAQEPTPSDDEVNAIARQMFCPICENIPLDVCPTEACHDWRELIRQMLAQGKTPNEIKQYFVDHYGARVLSEPPRVGLNWLVYVIPLIAFVAGLILLLWAFRMWKVNTKVISDEETTDSKPDLDEEYAARLEDELRKRN
jgi:cytochrome c-type biogenesis protein CcmH